MSESLILGICRFSYLGLGDWKVFRKDKTTPEARLDEIAEGLFAEDRLAARFRSFETICLPSILAQQDPNFIFLIVSSPRMPAHWRKRLHKLCDPHEQIHLLWSDAPRLNEALEPTLRELYDHANGRMWQFRLDDDDAIDGGFLPRLRQHIMRMRGIRECAISLARGLHVTLYDGQPTHFMEYRHAFWGAGLALKLARPGMSIFGFGHFGMRDRFTHFVDHHNYGALILKWPSDSIKLDIAKLPPHTTLIDESRFRHRLTASFPFLEKVDFETLRPTPLVLPETSTEAAVPDMKASEKATAGH